jgi:hypothetical protein
MRADLVFVEQQMVTLSRKKLADRLIKKALEMPEKQSEQAAKVIEDAMVIYREAEKYGDDLVLSR